MTFFRTFIDEPIQKELFNRIDSLNFKVNDTDILKNLSDKVQASVQHQYAKACWARIAVSLGDNDGTVFTLGSDSLNPNTFNDHLNPSTGSIDFGYPNQINPNGTGFNRYRGRAGITSINSSFKEYFLKTATINIFVPNPNEFDNIKDRFLKFGRYIFAEWGWSLPYNTQLPALTGETIREISNDIQERVRKGKGNYTAIVGVVTNYNFNQTKEGAYEASIEISSMGRNIFGQGEGEGRIGGLVGYANDVILNAEQSGGTLSDNQQKVFETLRNSFVNFEACIKNLEFVAKNYIQSGDDPDYTNLYTDPNIIEEGNAPFYGQGGNSIATGQPRKDDSIPVYTKPGIVFIPQSAQGFLDMKRIVMQDDENYKKDDKQTFHIWVSWGWFEDYILNSFFSFVSKDNDKDKFKTEFFSADTQYDGEPGKKQITGFTNTICRSHSRLQTLGFDSVVLPGKTKRFSEEKAIEDVLDGKSVENNLINNNTFSQPKNNRKLKAFHSLVELFNSPEVVPQFENEENKTGEIRNMMFDIHYLKESFLSLDGIENRIQRFWEKVSNDYGNFWNFALTESPTTDGRIQITDLNIGKEEDKDAQTKLSNRENPNKIFRFPIYESGSIVTDIQLQSENSSEMATLAVYGSNVDLSATSADTGKGNTYLAMRGLSMIENLSGDIKTSNDIKDKTNIDNILNNMTSPVFGNFLKSTDNTMRGSSTKYTYDEENLKLKLTSRSDTDGINFSDIPEITRTLEKTEENMNYTLTPENATIAELYDSFSTGYFRTPDNDKEVQIYNYKTGKMFEGFKKDMLFTINKAPGDESNYSAVLPVVPIQLSLTLQGIGGIKIGDLFYVDYLPKKYRKYCHFMVVNVDHTIDSSGWTTKLDSRMIVDIPKVLEDRVGTQVREYRPFMVSSNINREILFQVLKALKKQNRDYAFDAKVAEQLSKESGDPWSRSGGSHLEPWESSMGIGSKVSENLKLNLIDDEATQRDKEEINKALEESAGDYYGPFEQIELNVSSTTTIGADNQQIEEYTITLNDSILTGKDAERYKNLYQSMQITGAKGDALKIDNQKLTEALTAYGVDTENKKIIIRSATTDQFSKYVWDKDGNPISGKYTPR
jgi:hypothetical protein